MDEMPAKAARPEMTAMTSGSEGGGALAAKRKLFQDDPGVSDIAEELTCDSKP